MSCTGNKSRCRTRCLGIALMAVAGIAALGWVVMLLWNWLLPTLFVGVQPVGYGQALGLLLLCKILFGGFRGPGRRRGKGRHFSRGEMTPAEREQLQGRLKGRWNLWCGSRESRDGTSNPPSSRAD